MIRRKTLCDVKFFNKLMKNNFNHLINLLKRSVIQRATNSNKPHVFFEKYIYHNIFNI